MMPQPDHLFFEDKVIKWRHKVHQGCFMEEFQVLTNSVVHSQEMYHYMVLIEALEKDQDHWIAVYLECYLPKKPNLCLMKIDK
jgi:hypothetical protein